MYRALVVVLLAVTTSATLVAQERSTPAISAQEIIAQYLSTMQAQQHVALAFANESYFSEQLATPNADCSLGATRYADGTISADGQRAILRKRSWGQSYIVPNGPPQTESTREHAGYSRLSLDGKQYWLYSRPESTGEPSDDDYLRFGNLVMQNAKDAPDAYAELVGLTYPGHFLLGYLSLCCHRMDTVLAGAQLALTPPEVVNGVTCHVVKYASPYGDGTLWIDPDHGFNIAQAHVTVAAGDIGNNGARVRAGSRTELWLSDVTFSEVGGLWYPTAGNLKCLLSSALGKSPRNLVYQWVTSKQTLSRVTPRPDLGAPAVFSTNDIPNGAACAYKDTADWYTFRDGQFVDGPRRAP